MALFNYRMAKTKSSPPMSPVKSAPKPSTKKITAKLKAKDISFEPEVNPDSNAHLTKYKIPTDRPVRIYCDGIYDLFHYGHARSLEQVKKMFPNVYLLVGCCSDEMTHRYKGKTVMTDEERYESLRHCRWVDEVVRDAPWIINQAFIDKHKIDFVAHDDIPYASVDQEDVYKFVKDQNKFIATKRTSSISTSDLITKIVYDYDTYVRRNLSRGVSPKDLNLSFLKEKEIQVTDSVKELQGKIKRRLKSDETDIKNNWETTKEEIVQTLLAWESKSHDFIHEFVELFGADGAMRRIFKIGSPNKRPIEDVDDGSESYAEENGEDGHRSPFQALLPEGIKRKIMSVLGQQKK